MLTTQQQSSAKASVAFRRANNVPQPVTLSSPPAANTSDNNVNINRNMADVSCRVTKSDGFVNRIQYSGTPQPRVATSSSYPSNLSTNSLRSNRGRNSPNSSYQNNLSTNSLRSSKGRVKYTAPSPILGRSVSSPNVPYISSYKASPATCGALVTNYGHDSSYNAGSTISSASTSNYTTYTLPSQKARSYGSGVAPSTTYEAFESPRMHDAPTISNSSMVNSSMVSHSATAKQPFYQSTSDPGQKYITNTNVAFVPKSLYTTNNVPENAPSVKSSPNIFRSIRKSNAPDIAVNEAVNMNMINERGFNQFSEKGNPSVPNFSNQNDQLFAARRAKNSSKASCTVVNLKKKIGSSLTNFRNSAKLSNHNFNFNNNKYSVEKAASKNIMQNASFTSKSDIMTNLEYGNQYANSSKTYNNQYSDNESPPYNSPNYSFFIKGGPRNNQSYNPTSLLQNKSGSVSSLYNEAQMYPQQFNPAANTNSGSYLPDTSYGSHYSEGDCSSLPINHSSRRVPQTSSPRLYQPSNRRNPNNVYFQSLRRKHLHSPPSKSLSYNSLPCPVTFDYNEVTECPSMSKSLSSIYNSCRDDKTTYKPYNVKNLKDFYFKRLRDDGSTTPNSVEQMIQWGSSQHCVYV